jgi:cytosine/adenosine deaminase-related metal-dependent hydrolase
MEEARALHTRFPSVPARTLIAMATHWGAEALGLSQRLGRLAPGMRPGIVAFEHEGVPPADPERFVLGKLAARRRVLAFAA